MPRIRPETAGEYLDKHINIQNHDSPKKEELKEFVSELNDSFSKILTEIQNERYGTKEVRESVFDLSEPFLEIEYKDSDKINVDRYPFAISLEYLKVPTENVDKKSFANTWNVGVDRLYIMKDFGLKRLDNDEEIRLRDIVPVDCPVFLIEGLAGRGWAGSFKNEEGQNRHAIFVGGKEISLGFVLTLMHEAGHVNDPRDESFLPEKEMGREGGYKKNLAKELLKERNAWAFAMNKLRPFFDKEKTENLNFLVKDVRNYALEYCLKNYERTIGNELESFKKEEKEESQNEKFDFGT